MALGERGSVGNVGWHEPEGYRTGRLRDVGAAEPPRLLREAGGPAMERARLEPGPRSCSNELRRIYSSIGSPVGLTTYQTSPTSCPFVSPGAASLAK